MYRTSVLVFHLFKAQLTVKQKEQCILDCTAYTEVKRMTT